ncbi:MAG: PHP domain-containing protein, partial [Clostridium sp.]
MLKSEFHAHTTASDGILSPKEVTMRALKNNVSFLAITDHDTISGIGEAILTANGTSL